MVVCMCVRECVFNDHNKERQLNVKGLFRVGRTSDVVGADIGSHNLQDRRLDILIRDTLDVAVPHVFVTYLQGLTADTIKDGHEA